MKCQACGKIVRKPIPLDVLRSRKIPEKYDSIEFFESREPRWMYTECYNAKVERLDRGST